jgi:hypothetical protein
MYNVFINIYNTNYRNPMGSGHFGALVANILFLGVYERLYR